MSNQRIIDGHSHIGLDWSWEVKGTLTEYTKYAKILGITDGILMPTPIPVLGIGQYKVIPVTTGSDGENHFIVQGLKDKTELRAIPVSQNPYSYANAILYQSIATYGNKDMNLHFVPLVHPIFDTVDYIEQLIIFYQPIALKLHGYAAIISPRKISHEFWELIRMYDIPLIIHTDADTSGENTVDYFYRNENSPLTWIQILQNYNIRAYLTHGIRLCANSCKIVNESTNLMVGLGPDSILSTCHGRLYSNEPYLETLFSMVNIDKICFDLDYPWNTMSYEDYELDWDSLKRIRALGLNKSDLEKVLCENVRNFYGL